jgi:hypothetical protein
MSLKAQTNQVRQEVYSNPNSIFIFFGQAIPTLFKCDTKDVSILHLNRPGVRLFHLTAAEYVCAAPGSAAVAFCKHQPVSDPKQLQVLPTSDPEIKHNLCVKFQHSSN